MCVPFQYIGLIRPMRAQVIIDNMMNLEVRILSVRASAFNLT